MPLQRVDSPEFVSKFRYDYMCGSCEFTFEMRRSRFEFKEPVPCQRPDCDGEADHQPNFGGTILYMSQKLGEDESRRLVFGDRGDNEMTVAHARPGMHYERIDADGNPLPEYWQRPQESADA